MSVSLVFYYRSRQARGRLGMVSEGRAGAGGGVVEGEIWDGFVEIC